MPAEAGKQSIHNTYEKVKPKWGIRLKPPFANAVIELHKGKQL